MWPCITVVGLIDSFMLLHISCKLGRGGDYIRSDTVWSEYETNTLNLHVSQRQLSHIYAYLWSFY